MFTLMIFWARKFFPKETNELLGNYRPEILITAMLMDFLLILLALSISLKG